MRRVALLGLMGMMTAMSAGAADLNIAFINLDRVFEEYHKTKAANIQLQDQADGIKAERKALIDDYKKADAAYDAAVEQADNPALSDEARDKRRSEAEMKLVQKRDAERKVRQFDETKQKMLDQQTREMRKKILAEIRQNLSMYAKGEGYTAVFDTSGDTLNGVAPAIYFDAKLDITDAFLPILNRGHAEGEAAE